MITKVYIASSWKNPFINEIVNVLRIDGHNVYDFRETGGFSWKHIDPNWETWSVNQYINHLNNPLACSGFEKDMENLEQADVCVYVTPCGVSASLEAGFAVGKNKMVLAWVPKISQPDLMLKMIQTITPDLFTIREWVWSFNRPAV